jgi:phosphomannomutase
MRVSGPLLASALIEGIRDQGADVTDIGLISTDGLYFAVGKFGFPAGVMVTASHNPAEYNGFKLCREQARPLSMDQGIGEIRDLVIANQFSDPGRRGDLIERDVTAEFVEHALSMIDLSVLRPYTVAVDAGNGMAGKIVPLVFERLPGTLIPLYFELDGTFPNHEANPIEPENIKDLQATVLTKDADIGIAFDGDADRMFIIDDRGQFVGGDMVTAMVARAMLEKEPGAAVVYNLICSRTVPETIEAAGGVPIRSRVGHSFIKALMREHDAVFGGEHSGHFYFRDFWRADSGMLAALHALAALAEGDAPLSEVLAPYSRHVASGEINSEVADQQAVLARIEAEWGGRPGVELDHLDGLSVLHDDWWFNVRASNTEPLLRLNAEGKDEATMQQIRDEVLAVIRS